VLTRKDTLLTLAWHYWRQTLALALLRLKAAAHAVITEEDEHLLADTKSEPADVDTDPTSQQPGVQLVDAAWACFVQGVRSHAPQVNRDHSKRFMKRRADNDR